jgi:hypothetical protein
LGSRFIVRCSLLLYFDLDESSIISLKSGETVFRRDRITETKKSFRRILMECVAAIMDVR